MGPVQFTEIPVDLFGKIGVPYSQSRSSPTGRSSGNPACSPQGCASAPIQIECERDIISAVCAARHGAYTVRAVGSRGSKNDCYRTDGVSLEFGRYDGVVAFDGRFITVQAGMKIGRLNEFLRNRGMIIPTCGEWQGATVAGSIATGSHGGSARHGIHSSSVMAMRLITADGTPWEVDRHSPYFDHVAVSVGALGIISTITLACVETFYLELETRVLPFDRYVQDHQALNHSSEFFSAVWFPAARRALTFAANRVPPKPARSQRMERFSVKTFLLDAASRYFDVNLVTDRRLARRVIDEGDRILCPIPDRSTRVQLLRRISREWKAMEVAVPLSRAADALVQLDRLLNDRRRTMLNAVGLRASPADAFSLSPCHERATLWIDLFYQGAPRFTDALGGAIEDLDGRCHWGKHIGVSERHLWRQYPRLGEFRQARAALDPNRTFCNPFTRRIDP